MDEAECLLALTKATTQRTAHHLLRQSKQFPQAIRELATLPNETRAERLREMQAWSPLGLHLTIPWQVVLCGRPNVGKSSLINALVGFTRSVVFDQPGTTRDVVSAETALEGWPVEFSDTAGLRHTAAALEAAGIARAREHISQADLVLVVLDASTGMLPDDESLLQEFPQAMIVWNKSDLATAEITAHHSVSAKTGLGIAELIRSIVERLVPAVPADSVCFPVTAEQVARLSLLSTAVPN